MPAKSSRTSAGKDASAGDRPVLLSGDNPQIPKGDGGGPVQAYIAAIPGWKHDVAKRLDSLIVKTIPGVRKAVKWNSPFYGAPSAGGWFLSYHCFTRYLKVTFFQGSALTPVPLGTSKYPAVRYLDLHQEDAFDEAQIADWIAQASRLPHERL